MSKYCFVKKKKKGERHKGNELKSKKGQNETENSEGAGAARQYLVPSDLPLASRPGALLRHQSGHTFSVTILSEDGEVLPSA